MQFTMLSPDDWHIHLREGHLLKCTVPHAARYFQRAIVMPNLKTPITHLDKAQAYHNEILSHIPKEKSFKPLMTLYLTEQTSPEDIFEAKASGLIHAYKYYPAHGTTHSEKGVRHLKNIQPALLALQDTQLPLLIHAETSNPEIDIFDKEAYFLEHELKPTLQKYPNLRIVIEHITTVQGIDFVKNSNDHVGATITAHHLLLNRNDLLSGGIHPHYYCLPIVKRSIHQHALRQAAISGHPRFFLGTDSAPHTIENKENACGCAGVYTAPLALELYAEVFEKENALTRLEGFASRHGANFYKLTVNQNTITLKKERWKVPKNFKFGSSFVHPFRAGEYTNWKVL